MEKLLLVDDNEDNLESLAFLLEDIDVEILRANSGKEAIEHVDKHEFAIILMDVAMPEMDGFETAQKIRLKSMVPIIFLTAHANTDDMMLKGYDSGGVDYLTKPIQTRALISKVEIFLTISRQKQMLATKSRELVESNWRLEKEIRNRTELEEKFQKLFNTYKNVLNSSIDCGLIAVDKKMNILFLNKTAGDIFNCQSDEMSGKSLYEIYKKEDIERDKLDKAINDVHKKGEHRFQLRLEKNTEHYLDCKISAISGEENIEEGYIFSMKEIPG